MNCKKTVDPKTFPSLQDAVNSAVLERDRIKANVDQLIAARRVKRAARAAARGGSQAE